MTFQQQEQATGAVAATVPALSTILMGADPTGLVLGLAAAVPATFILGGIDSRLKAFSGIALAALLAGYGTPAVALALSIALPSMKPAIAIAGPLVSLLIGALGPTAIGALAAFIKRRGDSL